MSLVGLVTSHESHRWSTSRGARVTILLTEVEDLGDPPTTPHAPSRSNADDLLAAELGGSCIGDWGPPTLRRGKLSAMACAAPELVVSGDVFLGRRGSAEAHTHTHTSLHTDKSNTISTTPSPALEKCLSHCNLSCSSPRSSVPGSMPCHHFP